MKDEEMVEEYADRTRIVDENTRAGTDCISLVQDYEGNIIDIHERIKQAFLAGLKAGRPQWHDINDTEPSEEQLGKQLLIRMKSVIGDIDYDYLVYKYSGESITDVPDVIAWCEIPTFDKE